MTIIATSASTGPVSSAAGPHLSDLFPFLVDGSSPWPFLLCILGFLLLLLGGVYLENRR